MVRSMATRAAITIAAIAVPYGAAEGAPDDTAPGGSVATEPSAATTVPTPSAPDGAEGDGGEGGPPVDIEFQVDMLLGLVPEEEMQAYWAEQSQEQELEIQACMNEAGFEYNPQDADDMMSFDQYQGMSQLEWAQQWGFGFWTGMDPENNPYMGQEFEWSNDEIVNALSASEQNAWFEVNNRCSEEIYSNVENDPYRNPMVQQAMEDFETQVENDPRMREAQATWVDCMAGAGHPFTDLEAMYQQVYGDEDDFDRQNEFYESEAWKPESPDHAEWQRLVDEEIEIAVADATCTPPMQEVREEVSRDLRPELVAVWQTVDWSLPPVTYPGEGELIGPGGEIIVEGSVPVGSEVLIDEPLTSAGPALDLSEAPPTTAP
jgi:hypothetical protein